VAAEEGTVVAPFSFSGRARDVKPNTAAGAVLSNEMEIRITLGSADVVVGGSTWTIQGTSGNHLIHGTTDVSGLAFVICRGPLTPKGIINVAGIVYDENIGDGQDPGTWEADESGETGGG
jgi:hypothetical protein